MMDPAFETDKGLENLKNAFLIYLIASVLALIPVVGGIGGILDLVALIFLILGWRALGRSSLAEAPNYKSTGRWFIYAIIIAIVIFVVGIIISVVVLFSTIATQHLFNATSTGQILNFPSNAFGPFFFAVLVTSIAAFIVWISAWYKMRSSTSKLAAEVSQPRIAVAGLLYLIQYVVGIVAGLGVFYSLFSIFASASNLSSISGANMFGSYYGLLGGSFTVIGILGFSSSILGIFASYYGYTGVKGALASNVVTSYKTPPPPLMPQQGSSYCPKCGHRIDNLNSAFCSNCGNSLKGANPQS